MSQIAGHLLCALSSVHMHQLPVALQLVTVLLTALARVSVTTWLKALVNLVRTPTLSPVQRVQHLTPLILQMCRLPIQMIQAAQPAIAGLALHASKHQLLKPLLLVAIPELVVLLVAAQEVLQVALVAVLEPARAQVLVMALELARALVAAQELAREVDQDQALELEQEQGRVMIKTLRKLLQVAIVTFNSLVRVMLSSAK